MDDPHLSMATLDQIIDELRKRSIGCLVACVIKMTDNEEHVYANWHGKTIAIGLCERVKHSILNTPSLEVPDDAG
jgi:hypothetical protein